MRRKLLYVLCCLGVIGVMTHHMLIRRRYVFKRVSAAFAKVEEGRSFNDGWDDREALMKLVALNVRDSRGVFAMYPRMRKSDVSAMATVGFLTYHLYPIPVNYNDESSIERCDYIVTRQWRLGALKNILRERGYDANFIEVDRDGDYVLFVRRSPVRERLHE